jgi:hypothetical protein
MSVFRLQNELSLLVGYVGHDAITRLTVKLDNNLGMEAYIDITGI